MPEKLAIKAYHAFMFVPFHAHWPSTATNAFGVRDFHTGYEQNLPPFLTETHTPVQILAMQKIGFIHRPDIIYCCSADKHECAGDGFDFNGLVR